MIGAAGVITVSNLAWLTVWSLECLEKNTLEHVSQTMHLCLRCLNINKRIWYSRKDECRKAPTGIQRCQLLCVFMHVYTQAHLAVYNTQGEKVAMGREGAGSMKKKKKCISYPATMERKEIYKTCQGM